MHRTDDQLIEVYRSGDQQGLTILVSRYIAPAYRYAWQFAYSKDDSEDIVQESFVKAWKHLDSYQGGNRFRPWLFRIIRNTAIDMIRKRRDVPMSVFDTPEGDNVIFDTIKDTEPLQDAVLEEAENAEMLFGAVGKLTFSYQEVLTLRYQDGCTFDEIGNIVGKPLDTVKSQHRRALIALRGILEAQKNEDNGQMHPKTSV